MTNQEKIFTLLALEGDVIHKTKVDATSWVCSYGYEDLKYRCPHSNPDLTTPDGVMWMLVRLPKWGRYTQFCEWLNLQTKCMYSLDNWGVIAEIFPWLATDAKDGKSPALFKALCEFEGLEVEW